MSNYFFAPSRKWGIIKDDFKSYTIKNGLSSEHTLIINLKERVFNKALNLEILYYDYQQSNKDIEALLKFLEN